MGLVLTVFTSCSNDDDTLGENSNKNFVTALEGNWMEGGSKILFKGNRYEWWYNYYNEFAESKPTYSGTFTYDPISKFLVLNNRDPWNHNSPRSYIVLTLNSSNLVFSDLDGNGETYSCVKVADNYPGYTKDPDPEIPKSPASCNLKINGQKLDIRQIAGDNQFGDIFNECVILLNDGEYSINFMRGVYNPFKSGDDLTDKISITYYKNGKWDRRYWSWADSNETRFEKYGHHIGSASIKQLSDNLLSVEFKNCRMVANDSEGIEYITVDGSFTTRLNGLFSPDNIN